MKRIVLIIIFTLTGILSACSDGTIKIPRVAVIAPMTGPAAVYGEWIKNGIEKAVADGAKEVAFDFLDSAGDPKTAVTLAQKAISNERTVAFWTVSSADTMAIRDLATQEGVTLITSSATSPDITDGRKNVYRTIVNSAQETEVLVTYAVKSFKPSKVSILHINDAGGKASLDQFKLFLGKHNVSVVFEDSFEKNPGDIRVLVSKALVSRPDLVVVTGYSGAMGHVISGIRGISRNIPILCNQGLESPENLSLPPSILTAIRYSIAHVDINTMTSRFLTDYEKLHGKSPGLYEITAYDTANMINKIVKEGATGRMQLGDQLRKAVYEGVNGKYRFSTRGNVIKDVAIKAIEHGTVTLEAKYFPTVE